jgi:elongator complex protein 2
VKQTLRTTSVAEFESKRVVTALSTVCQHRNDNNESDDRVMGLASGFSDGTVNYWTKDHLSRDDDEHDDSHCNVWIEHVLQEPTRSSPSITDIDGMVLGSDKIMVVCGTSVGVSMLCTTPGAATTVHQIANFATNTVQLQTFSNYTILLVGTAAPRHNKVHVYWIDHETVTTKHIGQLMGHEDWLTDFAWSVGDTALTPLLASASQDARIRLWEFKTTLDDVTIAPANVNDDSKLSFTDGVDLDVVDDDAEFNAEEEDEGEARLEVFHSQGVTRVTLEALLYGHEEPVTSVAWHPKPRDVYRQDRVLLSSSMDRTLLIWACLDGGVWTPLSRVGAAGGILGGSVGSTLLGFLGVAIDPVRGESLVGHAYGGALHVWTLEKQRPAQDDSVADSDASPEEIALRNRWKATPCVTGHFAGVSDCCWESTSGEYLLTVSNDQTCRLWGPVKTSTGAEIWVELSRPQVHGYDLTTLASISTPTRRHRFVSGADEKEIRVFDAPMNAIKILEATNGTSKLSPEDGVRRVERAYIPSLGLSNKASAADGADEDTDGVMEEHDALHLPLERDLGAVSLWPEAGKLYGHNTELYCLTFTQTARSGIPIDGPFANENLVASSAKARDVNDASIRIWDVESGKCVQVLSGGHKATVATLAFSPDGAFLASSGKDRRLCIWNRIPGSTETPFTLATAVESAHKRIIWSAHFCPHEPCLLASGSRDGIIKVWRLASSDGTATISPLFTFEATSRSGRKAESVTAVSFAPIPSRGGDAVLAVGLDDGLVEIWSIGKEKVKMVNAIDPLSCHFATVTKLCWQPVRDPRSKTQVLASSSKDHGVRLFRVST